MKPTMTRDCKRHKYTQTIEKAKRISNIKSMKEIGN